MPSVFTLIINGELPGHCLWKDDICVSFLTINPLTAGHSLIVPIEETDHWLDLPEDTNKHLMQVASYIGNAQMEVYRPRRIGQIIAGFEVPHTHIHVLPISTMRDLEFSQNPPAAEHEDLAQNASLLRTALQTDGHEKVVDSFS